MPATLQVFALLWEAPSPKVCVTRWLITPHPADLSRIMQQRLVQEYVPFAAPSLNSHSADFPAVQWVVVKVRFVLFAAAA